MANADRHFNQNAIFYYRNDILKYILRSFFLLSLKTQNCHRHRLVDHVWTGGQL